MPSVKDVAKEAGVSTATVSHVINNTRYVSNETRKKVEDAMLNLQYTRNSVARSLRMRKTNIVGLLIPDISNLFFTSVAEGVEACLREHDYHVILSNSNGELQKEIEQFKIFSSFCLSGIILAPNSRQFNYRSLVTPDYPLVFLDRKTDELQGDCVLSNNEEATFQAVQVLIQKGYRRIGFICGLPGLSTTDERLNGYRRALAQNEIPFDPQIVMSGDSGINSGYAMTEVLTERGVRALFTANNQMTIGAMNCLSAKKIRIPDEVAMIGFDDYIFADSFYPPLSTIRQSTYELGQKAAALLLEKIENPGTDFQEYRVPTTVIWRKSC